MSYTRLVFIEGEAMLLEKTVKEYTDELASNSPTPGGGGTAALVGALGVALGDMVAELTVGKPKYAEVEEDVRALGDEALALKEELLALIDKDAEGFEPLAKAYGIPKDDPNRDSIMEEALNLACEAPLEIMRACCRAIDIIKELGEKGSRLAVSDAGCGAVLCSAALQAASLNVYINTKAMKDRDKADEMNKQVDAMLDEYVELAEDVFSEVSDGLRGL